LDELQEVDCYGEDVHVTGTFCFLFWKTEFMKFVFTGWLPKATADPAIVTRTTQDRTFLFVNQRPIDWLPAAKKVHQAVRKCFGLNNTKCV